MLTIYLRYPGKTRTNNANVLSNEDCLTPTEEATVNAIEADLQRLFERWAFAGFPPTVIIPMAFVSIVDATKHAGVSFENAVETLRLIWHGHGSN